MKPAHWLLVAVAVIGLIGLMLIARHKQSVLERGLPPRIVCADAGAALKAAGPGAIPVLGTGSMSPYIPPAPAGSDPMQTVVAYALIDPALTYADITPGVLGVYAPDWTKGRVMHQLSSRDSLGWIGNGLHNAHSEAAWRITPQNFVGIVSKVYVWPQ